MSSRADTASSTPTNTSNPSNGDHTGNETATGGGTGSPTGAGNPTGAEGLSFPRLMARTGSFRFGAPKVVGFARDGATVVFLRSRSGTDRSGLLWAYDVAGGTEQLLADPVDTLAGELEQLSAAERSRRERSRETGSGIVAATLDETGSTVAFTLSSRLFAIDLGAGSGPVADPGQAPGPARELPAASPVLDPRLDPTGRWVAYSDGHSLHVTATDGSGDRVLAEPDTATVSWGVAEFAAAEEMGRSRGYWWAPDSTGLVAARVEESAVALRTVADPSRPRSPARGERYPFAGTANADVSLWWLPLSDGGPVHLRWDTTAFPYLAALTWSPAGPPLIAVQSRDQRAGRILTVDPRATGSVATGGGPAGVGGLGADGNGASRAVDTHEVVRSSDPAWLELFGGVPAWLPGGRVLTVVADTETDTYRLAADGVSFSPPGLQLAAVLDVGPADVLTVVQQDPVTADVALIAFDGTVQLLTGPDSGSEAPAGSALAHPGVHSARRHGETIVVERSGPEQVASTLVVRPGAGAEATIRSLALAPAALPAPELMLLGPHELRSWLFLPATPGSEHLAPNSLPVLLAPYGGPGAAMVRASARRAVTEQWWADQGFAVLVVDNRGTPGRGPAFDRTIRHDFAGVTLDDQVEALAAASAVHPELDLTRVAIHGWSFGGYLAALAVLRRPDVFAAAVAGAPPTNWHLYDTHYTERYLGHPDTEPEVYARNGLLGRAADLQRPLMIIHGLDDDNVLVAHSLELSRALLRAGRPHTFLPLSGITHMTSDEDVAENLLLLQLDFLKTALGMH